MPLRAEPAGVYESVLVRFVDDETVYGASTGLSSYEAYLERVADEAEDLVEAVVEEATDRVLQGATVPVVPV